MQFAAATHIRVKKHTPDHPRFLVSSDVAEFLAVKKRAGTTEASLYIYGPDIGERDKADATWHRNPKEEPNVSLITEVLMPGNASEIKSFS